MLLTVSIDNAHISFGVYREYELIATAKIAADRAKTEDEYAYILNGILNIKKIDPASIHHCMAASVVAPLSPTISRAIELLCDIKPIFVGPGIKTGLNIRIDNPAQLGADIVALTVGAMVKYSAPLILIDMGIVTTMSVVNESGVFCGTIIMPGVNAALNALVDSAGSLPAISVKPPKSLIGTNTVDSMRSGSFHGTCAMLDGMIDKIIRDQNFLSPLILTTGPLAESIVTSCSHSVVHDKNLLMDGLCHLHHKNALHPKKGQ